MKLKEYKEKKMQDPEFASAYAEVIEKKMREQWDELKETIIELRDNKGTCTQQEVCQFLANYMNVLEAQMEPDRKRGKWIKEKCRGLVYKCSACGNYLDFSGVNAGRGNANFCPNCGAEMEEKDG